MKINEILNEETSQVSEKWSKKYKRSIDCSHPKGFSQKAHCAGRKKHKESREICSDVTEGFNSKQEVIAHFIKQGKSAAAGAAAWERGWRGATKKKEVKPFDPEKNKNVRLPYIDEAASNLTKEDDLSIFIRELFKNCSDMMSIFKKDTRLKLYRGSKRSTPNFSLTRYDIGNRQKKIEQGSTDTPELLNQRMNLHHSADSGLPFRYGMFCTGAALDATEYGKLSVIFPMNGFKFCYSPKIRDLYGKIPAYIETRARNNNDLDTAFEFIDDLYNKADYQYGSSNNFSLLSEAILSHNEIMIYPPNNESSLYYYLVDYTFYRDKVLPLIFEKLNLVY
jgi:hypothetical protein